MSGVVATVLSLTGLLAWADIKQNGGDSFK